MKERIRITAALWTAALATLAFTTAVKAANYTPAQKFGIGWATVYNKIHTIKEGKIFAIGCIPEPGGAFGCDIRLARVNNVVCSVFLVLTPKGKIILASKTRCESMKGAA